MDQYGIPQNPALTTSSWVTRWVLQSFFGYEVIDVRRRPKAGWFGLAYDESFVMLRRDKDVN
jgi:hypothetical protein